MTLPFPRAIGLMGGQLPPAAPQRYQREARHDCHCAPAMFWPDADGCCQNCGRFPRSVVAHANESRKRSRRKLPA